MSQLVELPVTDQAACTMSLTEGLFMADLAPPNDPHAGTDATWPDGPSVWEYVPQITKTFLLEPACHPAWPTSGDISSPETARRRHELAASTAWAAMYAQRHGRRINANLWEVEGGTADSYTALESTDRAIIRFAAKVASSPHRITETDVAEIVSRGLTRGQVAGIALAAAAGCYFADALGT